MDYYHLSYDQLLADLYEAYKEARRHKRNKHYQLKFEEEMEINLNQLCTELYTHTYKASPSECFVIRDPKVREVFAASFRDRIVHHLYFSYVHEMLERTFIEDAYSCIKGRGTSYGVQRMQNHIRKESMNYQHPCYVLKMDIHGYFMHIRRDKLLEVTLSQLNKMALHRVSKYRKECWCERVDIEFVKWLSNEIIMLDPTIGCIMKGSPKAWKSLPDSKSLFCSLPGCGLPIGNLTSQFYSNVYMNVFDQWMKRSIGARHYGRYVDDFYVVSCDKEWLHRIIPEIEKFLANELNLKLNHGKTMICNVRFGVEYLGVYLKPGRTYVANKSLHHLEKRISELEQTISNTDPEHLRSSLSSILGVMRHHSSWHLRQRLLHERLFQFCNYGSFDNDLTKFSLL